MARLRTVRPSLLMRIRVLSDPAQSFVLRLPLACDDRGRARLDLGMFAEGLYPGQPAQGERLPEMLDELERHGFIERYTVAGATFLRMTHWDRDQRVDRPTPSRLPPSPNESEEESRARESFRALQGRDGKWQADQSLAGDGSHSREQLAFAASRARESEEDAAARREALAALARIQGKAEENESHHAAIRAVIEQMRVRGLSMRLTVDPPPVEAPVAEEAHDAVGNDSDAPVDAALVANKGTPSPADAFGLAKAGG